MKPPGLRPERLTLWLLLLALSTLFLCNVDKGYFYRPGSPNWNTAKNLAIAENLSPRHRFRLSPGLRPGPGGAPAYELYGRFPVGGYALVKLAILPFGNDLSAKVLAARMLMLLLFSGAALLAFHSLARITSRRWVALAATLMAFSSYYMLSFGNRVCVEYSVDLFAVMLAFHGMVVFVQEGRFRQLLAKTGVALLLGWHVYAFLLPFLVLGLGSEAVRAWKDGTALWPRARSAGAAVLRSRYTALGLASLLFGAAVLGFNFANEYTAFRGETPVTELPSFQSMLRRTTGVGQDPDASFHSLGWLRFLREQFYRVRVASVPLALADWGAGLRGWFPSVPSSASGRSGPESSLYLLSLLMAAAAAAALVRLARSLSSRRRRLLLAVLALSGFFWALPMRHNVADHPHEALYYVGVPLVSYSLLLLYVHRRWGRGPVVGLAVAALLAFVVSAFQMERRWRPDARAAEVQRTAMAELGAIRETVRGKAVLVPGSVEPEWSGQFTQRNYGSDYEWRYYLAGSVLTQFPDLGRLPHLYSADPRDPAGSVLAQSLDVEAAARAADFIVTLDRVESDALLTPGNQRVFLYGSAGFDDLLELYRAAYRRAVSGEPAARSRFDVYLDDRALFHVREPCGVEDAGHWIVVEVYPEDPKDLPEEYERYGHDRDFRLYGHPVLFEGKCIAVVSLPDHPISRITTGQRQHGWEVEIPAGR